MMLQVLVAKAVWQSKFDPGFVCEQVRIPLLLQLSALLYFLALCSTEDSRSLILNDLRSKCFCPWEYNVSPEEDGGEFCYIILLHCPLAYTSFQHYRVSAWYQLQPTHLLAYRQLLPSPSFARILETIHTLNQKTTHNGSSLLCL